MCLRMHLASGRVRRGPGGRRRGSRRGSSADLLLEAAAGSAGEAGREGRGPGSGSSSSSTERRAGGAAAAAAAAPTEERTAAAEALQGGGGARLRVREAAAVAVVPLLSFVAAAVGGRQPLRAALEERRRGGVESGGGGRARPLPLAARLSPRGRGLGRISLPLRHLAPVRPPFEPRLPRRGGRLRPQPPVEAVFDGVVGAAGQGLCNRTPCVAEPGVLLEDDGLLFRGEGLTVEGGVEGVVPPAG